MRGKGHRPFSLCRVGLEVKKRYGRSLVFASLDLRKIVGKYS